jgi:hypothetical protein
MLRIRFVTPLLQFFLSSWRITHSRSGVRRGTMLRMTFEYSLFGSRKVKGKQSHPSADEVGHCAYVRCSSATAPLLLFSICAPFPSHSLLCSDRLCEWVNSSGNFAPGPANDAILQVIISFHRLPLAARVPSRQLLLKSVYLLLDI